MEFVRQIINSNLLADRINLPESLKNRKIEITILPFSEINEETIKSNFNVKKRTIDSLVGIANKYARKDLTIEETMKKEKETWAEAMVDKYDNH